MAEDGQWYTNKELFEQISNIKNDFQSLSVEMRETRETIKKYNGLREEVETLRHEIKIMEALEKGKSKLLKNVREWGGWIVAILMLLTNFL
ncbi:beta-ketoacyl-[acyl-carrier-protein] synthase family protein [Virgibacillus salexigens]|uniref:Uncharacterized protein n=1 Tax=Virgibacillus kapii TaxID=1638645 RepID=A0ABQ2E055_9BACI|nr:MULTISPECIES: hypothetical protein [Virgibacillus]MYL43937.1 hypothetical protein [Virgibacillus massiliensis]GGJ77024.1 hypothetical protein GCM10007111_43380 [Virgibacillus kapii]